MINSNLKNANILIVDDQQSNIDVLSELLEDQGYENVRSTINPLKVFELVDEFKPDLLLLDLMMPELSGFEVMERLNSILSKDTYLPILILTADITIEAKQRALAGGAKDFLTKPFDFIEVLLRIKNLLETRYLHQQLLNQNQILEVKVKERTIELEKANVKLNVAKEKDEENDKIKTAFLETISYEMKTPLNNILGFSGIINSLIDDADIKSMLTSINKSGDNLLGITDDIFNLVLSDKNSIVVENQTFRGSDIFFEARIELIEILNSSGKNNKINLVFNPDQGLMLDYITSDRNKIIQVLRNIFKYTIKNNEEGTIEFGFYKYDRSKIIFYLKDSGNGLSIDEKENLFDLYHQVDSSNKIDYDGIKIGLAISKKLAEAMSAEISIDSDINFGSTFQFTFTSEIDSYSPFAEETSKINFIPDFSNKNILIAEDDPTSMQLIKIFLAPTKANTIECPNGFLAVKEFEEQHKIDLVLMDLRMPILDGYKATKAIREVNSTIPIIALTAYSMKNDKAKALKAGCNDVITKPIKNKGLFYITLKLYLITNE